LLLPVFNDINKKEDAPSLFLKVNEKIPLEPEMDEFDKARAIAVYLRKQIPGGRGLGLSSNKALELMLAGDGGVCSDFSQIFNEFCVINDIKVREWGTVEKFYNPMFGHTFNEIFSTRLNKWIVIDVGKNLFYKGDGDEPLSVIELFPYLRNGNQIKYEHFSDHVCIDLYKIDKTYSKFTIPFVISNYNNKEYDHYLNRYQYRMPSFMINALMIVLGKNYKFIFVLDNYRTKLLQFKKTA